MRGAQLKGNLRGTCATISNLPEIAETLAARSSGRWSWLLDLYRRWRLAENPSSRNNGASCMTRRREWTDSGCVEEAVPFMKF